MTKEKEIQKYMEKLGISKEEAEQLWKDDHEDFESPEMKEMGLKAKKINRREKSDAPRKKVVRERKVDPNKLALASILETALSQAGISYTPKNESEFHFYYCGEDFTVKLIKHRAPK